MSKRKYSVINYIESEESSYSEGHQNGETLAKLLKKEPTFNFKSYLDGLCNGYTIEFKSLKDSSVDLNNFSFETRPLVESINLLTYIEHEEASYNKGNKDGINIAKENDIEFINFKSYLDGVCTGYTNYEPTILNSYFKFFSFGNSDCVTRTCSVKPEITPQPLSENILDSVNN